jgi:hypothetical protein
MDGPETPFFFPRPTVVAPPEAQRPMAGVPSIPRCSFPNPNWIELRIKETVANVGNRDSPVVTKCRSQAMACCGSTAHPDARRGIPRGLANGLPRRHPRPNATPERDLSWMWLLRDATGFMEMNAGSWWWSLAELRGLRQDLLQLATAREIHPKQATLRAPVVSGYGKRMADVIGDAWMMSPKRILLIYSAGVRWALGGNSGGQFSFSLFVSMDSTNFELVLNFRFTIQMP